MNHSDNSDLDSEEDVRDAYLRRRQTQLTNGRRRPRSPDPGEVKTEPTSQHREVLPVAETPQRVIPGRYCNGRRIKASRWVFTLYVEPWNKTGIPYFRVPRGIQYLCGQPEQNTTYLPDQPAERRTHFQGFCCTDEQVYCEDLCNMLGVPMSKLGYAKSSQAADLEGDKGPIAYTKKAESAILDDDGESLWRDLGNIPRDHVNDKYKDILAQLKDPSVKQEEIVEANLGMYIRCHSGFDKIRLMYLKPMDRAENIVYLLQGRTRLGKTRALRQLEPNFTVNCYTKPKNQWWQGYNGQTTIVFDDLRESMYTLPELLEWLDPYACTVNVKGTHYPAMWTKVYITTNEDFAGWYPYAEPESKEALQARIPEENRVTFVERIPDGTYKTFADIRNYQLAAAERLRKR
jgi:hypothetical protein